MLVLEKRYGFRPGDFRLWIALHEVTHRVQFRAIPWMKDYFLSLVDASLGMIEPDPKRLVRALERAAECARKGRNPLDDGGLVALFATDEQRAVIDQVQALMSLAGRPWQRGDGPARKASRHRPGTHVGRPQGPAPVGRRRAPSSGS